MIGNAVGVVDPPRQHAVAQRWRWLTRRGCLRSVLGLEPTMKSRRITLGAALLAAAFLQAAVASADPTDVSSWVAAGPEAVTATDVVLPDLFEISTGTQVFDVDDPGIAGDPTVGTVDAEVTSTDILGVSNSEDVVASDLTGTTGDPTVGSVYDTTTFGDTGYANVFTDVMTVGATAPSVSDTIDTPYGDYTMPLALHLLGFYWHDDAALIATTDALGTSTSSGLAGIAAELGSVF
jgi:hypothetical protein